MRFLFFALIIGVGLGLLLFSLTNRGPVAVSLGQTTYENVPVWTFGLASLIVGVLLTGIVAVIEGAGIRLDNHRLRREMRKMETEINFLRTQPTAAPRAEPDALEVTTEPIGALPAPAGPLESDPPSAPVYDTDPDDWPPESDDDTYSGGRAV